MHLSRTILSGFVVLEGIDGSGTTTQLRLLERRLVEAGKPHHIGFEPTESPLGLLLRSILKGDTKVHPICTAHLFAADRAEHLYGEGGIVERTGRGEIVVSDRYLFSSLAYQGLTCDAEVPETANALFPLPELLVFLDLPAETALARVDGRGSREIYEHGGFQERVSSAYREVVRLHGDVPGMRTVTLDGTLPPDAISGRIWSEIAPILERLNCRYS